VFLNTHGSLLFRKIWRFCRIIFHVLNTIYPSRLNFFRRQFSQNGGDVEQPVLEYQLQQHRILPLLAGTYAMLVFSRHLQQVDLFEI